MWHEQGPYWVPPTCVHTNWAEFSQDSTTLDPYLICISDGLLPTWTDSFTVFFSLYTRVSRFPSPPSCKFQCSTSNYVMAASVHIPFKLLLTSHPSLWCCIFWSKAQIKYKIHHSLFILPSPADETVWFSNLWISEWVKFSAKLCQHVRSTLCCCHCSLLLLLLLKLKLKLLLQLLLPACSTGDCGCTRSWSDVLYTSSCGYILLVSMSIQSRNYVGTPGLLPCTLVICWMVSIINCKHSKDWFQKISFTIPWFILVFSSAV